MSQDQQSQKGMSSWLWLALLATLGLTLWTSMQPEESDDADMIVVNERSTIKASAAKQATTNKAVRELPTNRLIDWDQLAREPGNTPKDLFSRADWSERQKRLAQRVEKKPPSPPPQAPPLPFSYMGRMDDGPNGNVIYLADQEKSYTVQIGSKVGQLWRLDQEDKNNLYFTYLPLNLTRTLSKQAAAAAGFN